MNIYNGEPYLDAAIASVLAQSFQNWELVIWDDCSTDGSAKVCNRYSDRRIRYFLSPVHTCIGEARNLAIARADGQWLAFLDQDDIWTSNKLHDQYQLILANRSRGLGIVYGRAQCFDNRGAQGDFDRWHECSPLPEGDIFHLLLDRPSFICLSSAVLLKQAVLDLDGIPNGIDYCPDYYLFVATVRKYKVAALQTLCCWYRLHPGNMSSKYKIQIYAEALRIIEEQADHSEVAIAILKRRGKVFNSLIGLHEIVSGKAIVAGLRRIFWQGSISYLAFLPILRLYRNLRRRLMLLLLERRCPPA